MKVPSHIGIIMDGNGRWAKKRKLPRTFGHKAGVKNLKPILKKAASMGVSCLTVYAFSTENWTRPRTEVNLLMKLFETTIKEELAELDENNVKVRIIGRREDLSSTLKKIIEDIELKTRYNHKIVLNIALNYGGRAEIVDAVNSIILAAKADKQYNVLTEEEFSQYLYNPDFPEIELMIRTGREKRISNFMLWQNAYAELYFSNKYWPDFTAEDLEKAIDIFQQRERRFGGVDDKEENNDKD